MSWLKYIHDHHQAILHLLAKMEGNVRLLEAGEFNEGVFWDFKEFAEVITKELIPHFQDEEKNAYVLVVSKDKKMEELINVMLEEHKELNAAFDVYLKAVRGRNISSLLESSKILVKLLTDHIEKEENIIMPVVHNKS